MGTSECGLSKMYMLCGLHLPTVLADDSTVENERLDLL